MDPLQTSIEYLKGIGPNRAILLREELGLRTYQDLLHFFPNRYIDRSRFYPLNQLPQNNAEVQVKGEITQIKTMPMKRGKRLVAFLVMELRQLNWFGFADINGFKNN